MCLNTLKTAHIFLTLDYENIKKIGENLKDVLQLDVHSGCIFV
jgi:hypothetical protein